MYIYRSAKLLEIQTKMKKNHLLHAKVWKVSGFFPIHSILHFMLGGGLLGFNIQYIEVLQITKQFDSFYQMVEEKKERIQEEVKRL